MPVKYTSNLTETFFSEFYAEERTRIFLDNLNLLYVAFTRPESGLVVWAPDVGNRGAKGSIAELLHQGIQQDDKLRSQWREDERTWRAGTWEVETTPEHKHLNAVHLTEYLTSQWRDKLVIRQSGAAWFEDAVDVKRDKVNYGIYMHAVLSRMHYSDEMTETLSRIVNEGLITAAEQLSLGEQLKEILKDPRIAGWFSRDWQVRTEVPILLPGGEENRIDRLLINGKKALVVDFKTGAHKKSDEKQVTQYMDILRLMNYPDVEGYLLYLGKNEIVEVKSGGRPKVVQKARSRDQLELGL